MPRKSNRLTEVSSYDPVGFINFASTMLAVRTDARLGEELNLTPPSISKIRHGKLPVPSATLIRFHELSGVPFTEIRRVLNVDERYPL